eukprot:9496306-Pyramimonas_sp.AAC.5
MHCPHAQERAVKQQSADLQESEFRLGLKHMDYDCQVFRVFESKARNYDKLIYSKKQEYALKRHQLSEKAAKEFLNTYCRIIPGPTTDSIYKDLSTMKAEIATKHHINDKDIIVIGIVNWTAPTTISSSVMDLQANMIGAIATGGDKAITAILNPQFAYKKGQLYLAERMVNQHLIKRNLDFDKKFGLVFKERTDTRDGRLLIYDGRIVVPFGAKDAEYFFKDAHIMQGKTEPANMVKGSLLQIVEDVDPKALPSTTDSDGNVKGANKVSQIGQDGMLKLIEAMLDGAPINNRHAVIFWEVNPSVGNMFDAFVTARSGWNFPSYYLAMVDDPTHCEWLVHQKTAMAADLHINEKLQIGAIAALPVEMPRSLLEDPPTVPPLNKLVAVSVHGVMKLSMPADFIKQWATHPDFGDTFQEKLQAFYSEFGNFSAHSDEDVALTPGKRRGTTGDGNPSSAKKAL